MGFAMLVIDGPPARFRSPRRSMRWGQRAVAMVEQGL